MTVFELADRMEPAELDLWAAEDRIRDEERRDAEMAARLKRKVSGTR